MRNFGSYMPLSHKSNWGGRNLGLQDAPGVYVPSVALRDWSRRYRNAATLAADGAVPQQHVEDCRGGGEEEGEIGALFHHCGPMPNIIAQHLCSDSSEKGGRMLSLYTRRGSCKWLSGCQVVMRCDESGVVMMLQI